MLRMTRPVVRALEELPENFRDVVRLVDVEELSYRDAAEALGIPLGTVMSRLHRGRRMLADALSDSHSARRNRRAPARTFAAPGDPNQGLRAAANASPTASSAVNRPRAETRRAA